MSSGNQNEQSNLNNQLTSPNVIEYSEISEQNEPNKTNENEKFKIRQINVKNTNKGFINSSKENISDVSVPSLINKTNTLIPF